MLSEETGASLEQITVWFINQRARRVESNKGFDAALSRAKTKTRTRSRMLSDDEGQDEEEDENDNVEVENCSDSDSPRFHSKRRQCR